MRVGRGPRGNPFSTRHVKPGAIPFRFPEGQDADTLTARLERQGWLGQIVGPHGSGKSTLLAAMLKELRRRRSVVAVELHRHERSLPADVWSPRQVPTLLVIDGYEQLRWWTRRRVRHHCRRQGWGLLVTAHRDLGLPELWRTAVTPELARDVVEGLLAGGPPARVDWPQLDAQLAHHRGNFRDVLFDLYDRFEEGGREG